MKITFDGSVFEGTPEEIKEMMTLMGAEFPESAKPKAEEVVEDRPKTEKRKARVGERILITNAEAPRGQYKNGDILTVSKEFGKLGSPHAIQADGVGIGIYHNEYEVIIEESTPKFKEGDRVKALADGEYGYVKEGDFGTVVDILNDEDDPHFIEVKTADDYDYFRPQDLELIAEERELKKGDIVRVIDSPSALPEGTIFEVESIDKYGYVYDDSPKNYVYMLPQEQLELIAPVESRVDVE